MHVTLQRSWKYLERASMIVRSIGDWLRATTQLEGDATIDFSRSITSAQFRGGKLGCT